MRVTFPRWPIWSHHFPEKDVRAITSVIYRDTTNKEQELAPDFYRLAIGRNGVSSFVLLSKGELPTTTERADAVTVNYECPQS